jgi:hypothetical protein
VNERLARHYGIPGIYGERFAASRRRVRPAWQGSILAVTSNANAPAGAPRQVTENLAGSPPPPAPTCRRSSTTRTVRRCQWQQMEQHRANACASCHRRDGSAGLALENLMRSARRIRDADTVDAATELPMARRRRPARFAAGAFRRPETPVRTMTES